MQQSVRSFPRLTIRRTHLPAVLLVAAIFASACGSSASDDATAVKVQPVAAAVDESEQATQEGLADEADDEAGEQAAEAVAEPTPEPTEVPPTPEPEAVSCTTPTTGVQDFVLASGGNDYDVRVFVPDAVGTEPLPLVLNWHGLGSDGEQQSAFSQYELLAATEGFLVAAATGFPSAGDDQERNSWELPQFDIDGRDDIAFASDLIDLLVADFCADEKRVYSTGMSNGGLFTSQLVCQLGDRIAAAVSIAGVTRAETCDVSRGVPFLAFHGTEDDVVPYDGTTVTSALLDDPNAPPESVDFFSQVMPDEFGEIAVDMGCDAEPEFADFADDIRVHEYQGCLDGARLAFYEVIGAGHTWPGSPFGDILEERGLGGTTPNFDATADAWAFMQQYSLG